MDFLKWLNSLDELLYELASWLAFFPLTLWRTVAQPLDMMKKAQCELALPAEEQHLDALSPPLFLALTLLCAHALAIALGQTDALVANKRGLAGLVTDDASALLLRVLLFSAFPLLMAARLLRRTRVRFNRATLRGPFYAQCYPTGVLALGLSAAISVSMSPGRLMPSTGALVAIAAGIFYVVIETRWFMMSADVGPIRALSFTLLGMVEGCGLVVSLAFLLKR